MKTSLVTFGALIGLVSGQNAIVHNHCATPVYVQSFPYDGSAPGPLTTIPKDGTFSEKFRVSGSTIKMGKAKTLAKPLFFGYSFSSTPDYAYCECT
ncbi:uncharacterized protein PFLUO_LOCUS4165 [Penicillium psychrofluorescens]|uniref:uncharacterized protein n=1 Tax=Penicillium psychrofluorescens TaxID=3158075 RepID=UPI003CCCE5AB